MAKPDLKKIAIAQLITLKQGIKNGQIEPNIAVLAISGIISTLRV